MERQIPGHSSQPVGVPVREIRPGAAMNVNVNQSGQYHSAAKVDRILLRNAE